VVVSDIATDPLWAQFRVLTAESGLAACWSTPILARDGRLLDTFAMYHRACRMPQETDLALACSFADTAALAIERHQAEADRRAAEAREKAVQQDLAFLLAASTALAADLDERQTLQRLATLCTPILGTCATIDVVEAGRMHHVAAAAPDSYARGLLRAGPVAREMLARVVEARATEAGSCPADGPESWRAVGVTAYACVPLIDRQRPFGALTLLSTGEHRFDAHHTALAEELARRGASAARNARQHAQRAALARELQSGLLLPDLPEIPGIQLAAFYQPAGEDLDISGDFYDVFPLDTDSWAFVLGDVCGRGAAAATTTALVRHTARAVAPLLKDPVAVVKAVDQALQDRYGHQGSELVTLVYGVLTPGPDGLSVRLVRAGHTPPLLLHPDRTVEALAPQGGLLGTGFPPEPVAHHLLLPPQASLLLYTDGITECRGPDADEYGEPRLARTLARIPRHTTAADVITAVAEDLRCFLGETEVDDDQAALVIGVGQPAVAEQ
jgi:serine phosphatase RsbU (regulator of sigma subunit)